MNRNRMKVRGNWVKWSENEMSGMKCLRNRNVKANWIIPTVTYWNAKVNIDGSNIMVAWEVNQGFLVDDLRALARNKDKRVGNGVENPGLGTGSYWVEA